MKNVLFGYLAPALLSLLVLASGCSKKPETPAEPSSAHHHEHQPPHGGTPIVLGDERYHLELVHDAANGKLQAYVLDGEMENFVRLTVPNFEVEAVVKDTTQSLVFQAVANLATGETVGDTSLFEAQADWLKSADKFDGVLQSLTIRGTNFTAVKFNFPKGNDGHSH